MIQTVPDRKKKEQGQKKGKKMKKGNVPTTPCVREHTQRQWHRTSTYHAIRSSATLPASAAKSGNQSLRARLFFHWPGLGWRWSSRRVDYPLPFPLAVSEASESQEGAINLVSASCLHKYHPPLALPCPPTTPAAVARRRPVSSATTQGSRERGDGGNAGASSAPGVRGRRAALPRRRPHSRRVRRRRLAERARHVLRRQRRLGHHGRRVRVREPVQPGVRREQRGAEHGAVQRGAELRRLLRDQVREPARVAVVPPREPLHPGHRHQLLPAQLRPPLRQRRLVQPAPPALRPRHAHVPPHRRVPRRHRPRLLPPGALPEVWWGAVHHQRVPLLQPGADHQRGWRRRHRARERQGLRRVAAHVQELGPELAVQRHPRRRRALLPRHRQRPPHLHLLERRPAQLAVRPDLRGQELQGLMVMATPTPSFVMSGVGRIQIRLQVRQRSQGLLIRN